ncbi:MAG: hypothetical protein GY699_26420 [Desulfobacteraceae bacterium]|nr:hypothetical protein [Desulfobacteraceae bacterium]
MPDPYADDRKFWGIIIVLLPFIFAFSIAYYNSATSIVKPYQIFRDKYYKNIPPIHDQSKSDAEQIPADQILLQKDEKIFINNTCLVFKGVSQGKVNLEQYILEFDPNIPYSLSLTKESFSKGIMINNTLYRFVSLKKNKLYLRFKDPD